LSHHRWRDMGHTEITESTERGHHRWR
jgi:hypothetical protein